MPQDLEPLPPDVEEDGAVGLPLLTQVVGDGVGVWARPSYQSVSKEMFYNCCSPSKYWILPVM